jgi:hypothetical protein
MRFFEEYGCGCVSRMSSKKQLPGYCQYHGTDRKHIYRQDGCPADKETPKRLIEKLRKIHATMLDIERTN